jgi:hypothetical protein
VNLVEDDEAIFVGLQEQGRVGQLVAIRSGFQRISDLSGV